MALSILWIVSLCPQLFAGDSQPDSTSIRSKVNRNARVYGEDTRLRVPDTTVMPWSAVGMVIAHWGPEANYQTRTGSGVLIGQRVVLSCAHVVHIPGTGYAQRVLFIPGRQGESEPYGSAEATRVAVPDAWLDTGDDNQDLSLLALDAEPGIKAGYMKVVSRGIGFFDHATLNLAGYPAELGGADQYNAAGCTSRVEGNLVVHTIDASAGQSGGPLWYFSALEGFVVPAVFTGDIDYRQFGRVVETSGVAMHINPEFCTWISGFLAEEDTVPTACSVNTIDPAEAPTCAIGAAATCPPLLCIWLLSGLCTRRAAGSYFH